MKTSRPQGWASRRVPLAATLACLALALTCSPAGAEVLGGKVINKAFPLEGAVVGLYRDQSGGFRGQPDFQAGPTGADGGFKFEVPPGRYYLIARKHLGGRERLRPGDFYAYYGGNPITLGAGEELSIGVNCSPIMDLGEAHVPGGTGIRGRVFYEGQPLERARVVLYQDAETIFRGMGYASSLTTKGGDFSFNLEPGTYYVLARKRAGEDRFGPLAAGDHFAYAHDNPVEVREGFYSVIPLSVITKLEKSRDDLADMSPGGTMKSGGAILEGSVRDAGGKPAQGIYVGAYRDSMMINKPDFISDQTGPDGRYSLNLSGGGVYFIGARNTLGGPALRGDLLGRYAGTEDHSVVVKPGERKTGIDIVVERVE